MLKHLKLENFKIWRSTGPIRMASITLLLGTNSSGKSSLIQSLLIRQTVISIARIFLHLLVGQNQYTQSECTTHSTTWFSFSQ